MLVDQSKIKIQLLAGKITNFTEVAVMQPAMLTLPIVILYPASR